MAAPMEVSLPQTMLQKLLHLLKLESLKFCLKINICVIHHIRCQVNFDYHNQDESPALIGLFHATSSVLPSVESYPNYRKPTQRGVQGYLSSLQRRVAAERKGTLPRERQQQQFLLCLHAQVMLDQRQPASKYRENVYDKKKEEPILVELMPPLPVHNQGDNALLPQTLAALVEVVLFMLFIC